MNDASPEMMSIFCAALERVSAEERAAYVEAACGQDMELRARIEALLQAHEQAGGFLPEKAEVRDAQATVDELPVSEHPGTMIGPYRLLQPIGEGGMGTVFLAEQTHPVQRKVALKLIKSGMDSRQVIARFEAERQALALMDHPNIAWVLDAGTTESSRHTPCAVASDGTRSVPATLGRPYFVMELVKGVPITRYCDEHHLTPRQRLELFVPVCQAVQHAHQKGIIHRDIKPSNVMVCLYDGKPVPKVIDFGIAKATGPSLTEKTLFTEIGQVVGTLEYMSPEQAELNQLDIDTRSDIYSLGVLLYELLTGTTPLERKRFKEVAFLEVLRLIREEESPKPSTRLSELSRSGEPNRTDGAPGPARLAGPTSSLASIAANRGLEPKKLNGMVRGELDWIVMKTLEKDRNRRYETANGLAMDVQRYLADEPVQACPPSAGYKLRKFVRRNRGPVLAATLVLLALVGGIIGTTWQAVRATWAEEEAIAQRDEKDEARREAVKERDEKETARAQAAAAAEEARKAKDAESVQRQLAEAAREEERKAKDAESAQRQRAEAARDGAARTLDAIKSIYVGDTLAQEKLITPDQKHTLDRALKYYRGLLREQGSDEATRKRIAGAALSIGLIETRLGRKQEGAVNLRQAQDVYAKLATEFPAVPEYRYLLVGSQVSLARLLDDLGEHKDAETAYGAAIGLAEKLVADSPKDSQYREYLGNGHHGLGIVLKNLGKPEKAEAEFRAALGLRIDLVAEFPKDPEYRRDLAMSHAHLGDALRVLRKPGEREAEIRVARDIFKQLVTEFPDDPNYRHSLASGHHILGTALRDLGKPNLGEAEYRAAIKIGKELVAEFPAVPKFLHDLAAAHNNLGLALYEQGKWDEAIAAYRECLRLEPNNATTLNNLGGILWSHKGDYVGAAAAFREAIRVSPKLAEAHVGLGNALENLGKVEEAIAAWEQANRLKPDIAANSLAWTRANCADPRFRDPAEAVRLAKRAIEANPKESNHWNTLGASHYRAGDWKAAIAAFEKSMALSKGGDGFDWFFLAMAHERLGNKAEARKQYDRAVAWMEKHQPKHHELRRFRAEAAELLGLDKLPKKESPQEPGSFPSSAWERG